MDQGQLPGLYYDPEKKRYFPIKANHQAIGSASKYSQENVRKRDRLRQARHIELARNSRLSKEMLKRSYLLDSSVSSALLLQRGIGYRKELRHSPGDAYVGLLQRNTLARSTKFQIAKFLKNPESGDIYAGFRGSGTCNLWACSPILGHASQKYDFNRASRIPLVGLQNGEITSLSMHRSGFLLAAAGSYTGNTVQVTLMRLLALHDDHEQNRHLIQDVSTDFRFPGSAIRSTAANPRSDAPCFAVGVSEKLHIFGIDHSVCGGSPQPYNSDILALEWLNHNTVMAGLNNSLVSFYDTRSNGSAMRVQHPHAVCNIRVVDDWRIAVAGRKNTLRIYDLRYAPGRLQHRPKPTRKSHFASPAYLIFSDYVNEMPGSDSLDIAPELGLMASISGENDRIQVFSLATGQEIFGTRGEIPGSSNKDIGVGTQKNPLSFRYQSPITCLRVEGNARTQGWGQFEEAVAAPSITVCSGNTLDEWVI